MSVRTLDIRAVLRAVGLAVLGLSLCQAPRARAQDVDPSCDDDWGCWDLVYSSKGTVLGATAAGTFVHQPAGNVAKLAALTSYRTEHFGAKHDFSAHFLAAGAIGGGSAGTEGGLQGELDLGLRLPATDKGGPFLRGGSSGLLLGNHELYFSMLEPLRLRLGYQFLDGPTVFEIGMTSGVLAAGRYDPGPRTSRSLARSPEVGGYLALHVPGYTLDVAALHLPALFTAAGGAIDVARASLCVYSNPFVVCAEVLSLDGQTAVARRYFTSMHAMHLGFTLGLTP